MPAPTQVYASDRTGRIWIFDPATMANPSWAPSGLQYATGPALFGMAYNSSTERLYLAGVPDGVGLDAPATVTGNTLVELGLDPILPSGFSLNVKSTIPMPAGAFQPNTISVGSGNRLFIGDPLRFMTAWGTSPSLAQLAGSPYLTSGGLAKAQGIAFDSGNNRLYLGCQDASGQDKLAVYDAAVGPPMTQIANSPFSAPLGLNSSNTSIAVDVANNRIFLTSSAGLVVLNRASATFAPIAGSPFATSPFSQADPRSVVYNATAGRVYVANFAKDSLAVFSGTTAPTPISGSPFTTGHGPISIAFHNPSNRIYVANYHGGITVFDSTTMLPIAGSPVLPGVQFSQICVGP